MSWSIKIREKLLIPIILLIIIAIGSTLVLSIALVQTDENFEALINTQLKARFISKDISAQLSESGRLANLMLLQREPADFTRTAEQLQEALARIGPNRDALHTLARNSDPAIAKAAAAQDAMQQAVKPTLDLKVARDHEGATALWAAAARAVLTPARTAMNETADQLEAAAGQAVAAQVANTNKRIRNLVIVLAVLIIAVSGTALYVVLRGVVSPIKRLTEKIVLLSSGDGNFELPEAERGDELGAMGKALLVFRQNAEKIKAAMTAEAVTIEIGEVITQAAQDDLTVRVELGDKSGFLRNIGGAINELLERSNATLRDINKKTRQVAVAIGEASAAVGQVSGGARSQNEAVGQVTQALGETAKAIRMVSSSVNVANEKGIMATQLVERGQGSAEDLSQIVEKIAQNSRQISRITQVPLTIDTQLGIGVLSSGKHKDFQDQNDASQPRAAPEGPLG